MGKTLKVNATALNRGSCNEQSTPIALHSSASGKLCARGSKRTNVFIDFRTPSSGASCPVFSDP